MTSSRQLLWSHNILQNLANQEIEKYFDLPDPIFDFKCQHGPNASKQSSSAKLSRENESTNLQQKSDISTVTEQETINI